MKLEQACRFRLDVGYRTFDQSEGFGPDFEKELGETFNDTMNGIFPHTGSSILSCAVKKDKVFLARNTLRTDTHGRKTIFTHTYALNTADYASLMHSSPEKWLGIPMDRFLEYQAGTPLEALDVSDFGDISMDAESLFAKYNLTPQRYKELLAGTYEALTEGKPFWMKTDLDPSETEQMIREIAYCAVLGLPGALKGRLSFSSGADPRMALCTLAGGNAAPRANDNVFGVEKPEYTRVNVRDEVLDHMFTDLAQMSSQERTQALDKMQDWLNYVSTRGEGVSLHLISTAYLFSSGRPITSEAIRSAFLAISGAAGKAIPDDIADKLLERLLRAMVEENAPLSKNIMSYVASWYLGNSSEAYALQAELAMSLASESVCLELIGALIHNPPTERITRLVTLLVKKINPGASGLYEELQDAIVSWILKNNAKDLLRFASALIDGYAPARTASLAGSILTESQGRALLTAEDALLAVTLSRLTVSGSLLDAQVCRMMDDRSEEYSDLLAKVCSTYYVHVRLASVSGTNERLQLLSETARKYPGFMKRIEDIMAATPGIADNIWEHYQTACLLRDDMSLEQVEEVCNRCNAFQNPGGPFEAKVAALIFQNVKRHFVSMKNGQAGKFALLRDESVAALSKLQKMNLSSQTRSKLAMTIVNEFWKAVSYKQICCSDLYVPAYLNINTQECADKIRFLNICIQMMSNPKDAGAYIDLVRSQQPDNGKLEELQAAAFSFARRILIQRRYVSWDLLLLASWERDDKYDMDMFLSAVIRCDKTLQKEIGRVTLNNTAEDSILLQDAAIRKQVIKQGNYEVPEFLETLILELKGSKKRTASDGGSFGSGGRIGGASGSRKDPTYGGMQQLPQRSKPETKPDTGNERGGLFGWKGKGNR